VGGLSVADEAVGIGGRDDEVAERRQYSLVFI
jgi:hypothetical protein